MAPAQPSRVLRCYSCRLFQAHQVKKSLKWTCKACGEKQSFVRAYGEGSGADCRRHVQKLNLLQGQVSELSFRPLGEAAGAAEEEISDPLQAENGCLQIICVPTALHQENQPLESRWLKYLNKGFEEPELGGGGLQTQPEASVKQPNPSFSPTLPRKRKWNQSTPQPSCFLDVQDLDDAEDTLECQEGSTGLMTQQSSSHYLQSLHYHPRELRFSGRKLPSTALQVKSSKWARFLLSPENSPHVDTEPSRPLQWGSRPAGPAQAEQGTPETETPRQGNLNRTPASVHLPLTQRTHNASPMPLHNLFVTGEDFEDDL